MKAKYILSGLLMVALVIGGTGYGVAADSGGKVTGGGTFNNEAWPNQYANYGDKISFGFNGQTKNDIVKGQFQLINHDSGMKIHGTFSTYTEQGPNVYLDGSINGTNESFRVRVAVGAAWEVIQIWIGDSNQSQIYGQIRKGNITKHDK